MRGAAVEARRPEHLPPVTLDERRVQLRVAAGRGEQFHSGLIGCRHDFGQGGKMRRAPEGLVGNGHGLEKLQAKADQDSA